MSKPQVHYSEYIKQGIFILLVLGIALSGIKSCRKYQKKRDVIVELSSTASESAAYEQFYLENAHSNLYKSMFQMHTGVTLGSTPTEILTSVMENGEAFFSTEKNDALPLRQALIRDALLSNYDNCVKLGVFEDKGNLDALSKGEAPTIKKGPASGEPVVIRLIVPDSILPGVAKLLPNLMISPPEKESETTAAITFNNFEIARAKKLANSLTRAGLIEQDAYKKIVDFYNTLPATETEPITEPKTN